ncbi:MAG: cysteine desulfurase [Ruminococcaceae bacterium]|nr:cysteine desulfurase [Oscillospiraceae bacterium]
MNSGKKPLIYVDHAATTRITDSVRAAMEPYLTTVFGNASAAYGAGRAASRTILAARRRIAAVLGCRPQEIYFTSGGTEADNWAIKGTAFAHAMRGHVVYSAIEHHAVLHSVQFINLLGMDSTAVLPEQDGIVTEDAVDASMREDTRLAAVMLANNEIGTIQPITDIARAVHARGAVLFCDAVQAMGQIPVDIPALGADMLALSGHKIGAPKGIGLLYVKEGTLLVPLLDGGGQEMQMRAGTENVAAIAGLAQAIEDAAQLSAVGHLRSLQTRLLDGLRMVPGCVINGTTAPERRLPGNVNVSFPGLDAESLVLHLDRAGICCSAASACMAGNAEPSHVLLAVGCDRETAASSLRFSLGQSNTAEEMDHIINAVGEIVSRLYTESRAFI